MIEYKNYFIEKFMSGYTVYFNGDEVFFNTVEEAQEFIDNI